MAYRTGSVDEMKPVAAEAGPSTMLMRSCDACRIARVVRGDRQLMELMVDNRCAGHRTLRGESV